jgi:hypothetical protein
MATLQAKYPSKGTLMKVLPPLYTVVLRRREDVVRACGSFSTTFDLWTSPAGGHYCVVTYHALDKSFNMIVATLDLIPLACSAYGEFIYMAVVARIKDHGLDTILHAASFSDSGSNVAAAKALLTPNDDEPCFNHNLKHVIDDVLGGSPQQEATHPAAAKDFAALALLVAHVRGSPVLRSELNTTCREEGVPVLELIAANLTRWEGRYRSLERILKLRGAVVAMRAKSTLASLLQVGFAFPDDFMDDEFWIRLETVYLPILKRLHTVTPFLFSFYSFKVLIADQQGRSGEVRAITFLRLKVGARDAHVVRPATQRRQ